MVIAKTYGQVTKEYREEHNISIRKFAKMIGVGKSYLAKLEESGCDATPTLPILLATAEVMEKDPVAFLKKLGISMENSATEPKAAASKSKARAITPFTYIPPTRDNLQTALNEGRLMILPFKAIRMGIFVYIPSIEYEMAIANEVTEVQGGVYTCMSETLGITEFTLFDIGHTVFLSRTEAQKKLVETQNKIKEREARLSSRRKEKPKENA